MAGLPTGTVTFLFTDIEGSTRLLEQLKDAYANVLAECRQLVRTAVQERGGEEVDTEGDAVFAAFPSAREALMAAVAVQRGILHHLWPDGVAVKVRMGLHTGEARLAEGGYVGMDVHRAARICAAAHGGQILLSDTVSALVTKDLPDEVRLRDLGEHRLKDLIHVHHLFQVMVADLATDFPPIRSLDVLPNNLPRQLTSFVGREREMAEVKRLLSIADLVTLTGSGGAGKTRLALQVAADVAENYRDGVWLTEFASITDSALVPKTVASALNVPEQPGRDITETLVDALRSKALLLVLDNCEHLLAACRELSAALLRACRQVRILATSREGLGVPGETLWRVPSLSVPEGVTHLPPLEELVLFDAVRLFVDRAMAIVHGFAVTSGNATAVAEVCQRLDGIPLAIELAAARVKVLAVEQIAARLNDRFRLLTGGSQIDLPRHQTLRAAIDWSYQLLSESERALLRRLSVFAGGWTLEAAESVCAGGSVEGVAILDLLTSLVDKSLVPAQTQDGEARYRLLETVRQYARDRLVDAGEEAVVRTRHRTWCVTLAAQIEAGFFGPHQLAWMKRFGVEHDNLRMALAWSMEDPAGAEAGLRLAGALYWFWYYYGYWAEGRRWLESALARRHAAPRGALPKAFSGATFFAWREGDYGRARLLGDEGLAISGEQDDAEASVLMLCWLGVIASRESNYLRAAGLFDEGVRLSRKVGNAWLTILLLNQIGVIERHQGNLECAAAIHEESLSLVRLSETGDRPYTLRCLGLVELERGHYERATELFTESLLIAREMRYLWMISECLTGLAGVSVAKGGYDRAARLYGAAEALRVTVGHRPAPHDQADYDRRLASVREGLGDVTFAAAWAESRAMTLGQVIEYALSKPIS